MASAEQVKELRARTNAGIMECKKALLESGDDIEKAIEFLRKQGTIKAAKKSGRDTQEGLVNIALGSGGERAAMVEVNCETDFVARNEDFQKFVADLAAHALEVGGNDLPQLLDSKMGDKTVSEALQATVAVIGENMSIARFEVCSREQPNEKLANYVHAGNQIGVILKVAGEKVPQDTLKDVAMHIAAMHPLYVDADSVPAEEAEKEQEVLRSSPDLQGKPDEVVEKMIAGRFRKFLSQVCLVDQVYIKDPQGKQTVKDYLKSLDPDSRVVSFVRFQVGDKAS